MNLVLLVAVVAAGGDDVRVDREAPPEGVAPAVPGGRVEALLDVVVTELIRIDVAIRRGAEVAHEEEAVGERERGSELRPRLLVLQRRHEGERDGPLEQMHGPHGRRRDCEGLVE